MTDDIKLYKRRDDGSIGMLTLSKGMFSDQNSFNEALDHHMENGYYETREDAESEPYPSSNGLGM